jgi:hypothetical protein
MCAETEWLDNLVQQVRYEARKLSLSQAEVIQRLRSGETVETLFPALAATCQGRTSAYVTWEIQTHSWAGYGSIVGLVEGKSGHLHLLVQGKPGSGMGFCCAPVPSRHIQLLHAGGKPAWMRHWNPSPKDGEE